MATDDILRFDQKVRAAWMYYIAGLNQSEIAAQLGTSRPVIQRMIAAAKDEGIVSVSLHHPVANCLDYAQLLQEKYQLTECSVVPAYNHQSLLESVSFGCYQVMARYLQSDNANVVGVGSGLTLKKTIQRIDFDSPNIRCVALISAMNEHGQCNYYDDVPLLLARKIQAKYYQWPAPRYALSATEYAMWCGSNLFQNVSGVARECSVIFVGIGGLDTQSPIYRDGFIDDDRLASLVAQGGVGEILGRFINAEGAVIDSPSNQLITSYDIRQSQCPRIAAACGEDKRLAILAALKGSWINGLVTDETTARWLLTR